MEKGKVIAFEGLDACFKETQSKLLLDELRKRFPNNKVHLIDFPQYKSNSGRVVYELLHGTYGPIDRLPLTFINDTYSLDRACAWYGGLKESYEYGSIIIFDRWTYSNVCFQGARLMDQFSEKDYGMDFTTAMNNFFASCMAKEFNIYKLPRPDLVIHMDMSIACSCKIIKAKKNKDMNENDEFQAKVYKAANLFYDYLKEDPTIAHIKCNDENDSPLSIEAIHNDIMSYMNKLFETKESV